MRSWLRSTRFRHYRGSGWLDAGERPALRDATSPPPPSAAPRLDEERKARARIGLPSTLGIRFNALLVTPAGESQEEAACSG